MEHQNSISKNKYTFKVISFFIISSIILAVIFGNELIKYLTPVSFVLVITIILITYFVYYLVRNKYKYNLIVKNINDFRSFDYRFLSTKIFDVFFQQLLIISLINIGKMYGGNNYFLLSASLFILLHLIIFFYNTLRVSIFFLILSIPASIIFISIYLYLGNISFGIGYFIHLSFYLLLGLLDLKGNISKIIGQ